jgi:hypothetical protein
MKRDALRGFLQIGVFIGGSGFLLALAQAKDSPEFIVSICSGFIGLALVIAVIIVQRMTQS